MNIFKISNFSGEKIILIEAVLFSLFSVLSKSVSEDIPSLLMMICTWAFAGLFFIFQLTRKRQWGSLIKFPEHCRNIFLGGLIIGVGFHGLFFYGIQFTSAGNAAIIGVTEILFSFLFFHLWKKESENNIHIIGSLFMIAGIITAFWESFSTFQWNKGDLCILLAFAIAPIGNFFQQKVSKSGIALEMILFVRTGIIMVFFLPFLFFLPYFPELGSIPSLEIFEKHLFSLFFIGVFILGISKVMLLKAFSLISIPKVISINSIYPLFSFFFAYLILSEIPSIYQIIAIFPMGIGIWLLVKK